MSREPETTSPQLVGERPKINIPSFMRDFRNATHFREFDEDLVVIKDEVGLERVLEDRTTETYDTKMAEDRKKSGHNESVSWGTGKIEGDEFVGVVFNYNFMGGSAGAVAGEKFLRASDYAIAKNLPLIILCASGGQRQQEAAAAVMEMPRTVYACDQFREKTDQPLLFVLVGNVWGGITASVDADQVIGLAGTNFGFAGPRLIKTYQKGVEPSPDSQSVENSYLTNRQVHIIVEDQKQLLDHLDRTLGIVSPGNQSPQKPKELRELSGLDFDHSRGYKGFFVPNRPDRVIRSHSRAEIKRFNFRLNPNPTSIFEQYQLLMTDPRRPDPLYYCLNIFDELALGFNVVITEEKDGTHFDLPPIVYCVGAIDDTRLKKRLVTVVIGDQPSYIKLRDGSVIINQDKSNPRAWDYQNELAAINYAQSIKRPITTFVNTPGARPTEQDERDGQYAGIKSCIKALQRFPNFTRAYLTGIGGSGGAIATFPDDDRIMLSGAQFYVAVPPSAADILYPKGPTKADIVRTANGMRPDAAFLESRGMIDRVIQEPDGGAQNNPFAMARAIREDLILGELEFGELTTKEILDRRYSRIRGLSAIAIGHLSGTSVEHSRSRLHRLLRR